MKYRIFFILTFMIASTCAYSQHVANAMPVDIPLNSTKEAAIQKLLKYDYQLENTYDQKENGYLILYYMQKYNGKTVGLWIKNGRVLIVEWVLLGESVKESDIKSELEFVYGITPYAETVVSLGDPNNSLANEFESYYYWRGNTLVLNSSLINRALLILSNADAETRYQNSNQKKIEQQKRLEEKKRQEQQQLEEQRRQEREQLERKRKAEAKRKREADSIAHINSLKSDYSSCSFLFASENSFVSCITQANQNSIENQIKAQIDQKMTEISNVIVLGTEFNKQNDATANMKRICEIPNCIRRVSPTIANYVEDKTEDFVVSRKKLNKAFTKAKKKNPELKSSDFLRVYIEEDQKGTGKTSMKSIAEILAGITIAGLVVYLSVKKQM